MLGGAASLLAAPPLAVDALVIESVYPTIEDAIGDRLALHLGAWSRAAAPLLAAQLPLRLGIAPDELRPIDHVAAIALPKLIIAGAEDRHTTLDEARALFAAAVEPKEFLSVPGAAHVDLHAYSPAEYERRILDFLARSLGRPR